MIFRGAVLAHMSAVALVPLAGLLGSFVDAASPGKEKVKLVGKKLSPELHRKILPEAADDGAPKVTAKMLVRPQGLAAASSSAADAASRDVGLLLRFCAAAILVGVFIFGCHYFSKSQAGTESELLIGAGASVVSTTPVRKEQQKASRDEEDEEDAETAPGTERSKQSSSSKEVAA
ncbi:unnamed protein product [Amoebophrya sp. A120]|nr:unnamed protein product [Amoebophrya sp. A120]|eukprot:GSA120T00018876001.1